MVTVAGGTRPWLVFAAVVAVLVSKEALKKVLRNRSDCWLNAHHDELYARYERAICVM